MNFFGGNAKYFKYSMALGIILLFSFQNCGPTASPIEDTKEITYDLASTSDSSCLFNGVEVLNGDQVIAYASSTSSATHPCQPQEQICENGILKQPMARQFSAILIVVQWEVRLVNIK